MIIVIIIFFEIIFNNSGINKLCNKKKKIICHELKFKRKIGEYFLLRKTKINYFCINNSLIEIKKKKKNKNGKVMVTLKHSLSGSL